jgi:UDP-N-acetylglucosamine 2-epimerase
LANILTIVGARPQFIKAAAVSHVVRARHREVLLHTGQHYDAAMSDRFFQELKLPKPDVELGVGSGSHASQISQMLTGIESAIAGQRPDVVLLYGDTNSTLAGALAAAKMHVPIAHVEAGLRSFNRRMPEEINRVVTDQLSALLLCPSETAVANLAREGITNGVHLVGDVMADVISRFGAGANGQPLERFGVAPREYFVATTHRAENTDDTARLAAILTALDSLPSRVIVPMHPRLRAAIATHRLKIGANVTAVDPVGYLEMIALVKHARALLTDSGGLQKEAYWLGVPCVTMRDETEWIETVAAGWNTITGADTQRIVQAASSAPRPTVRPALYGDGNAAGRIVELLEQVTA